MDVVKITDGIGNQIFQYAFAKMLQIKGKKVYLDTRHINNKGMKDSNDRVRNEKNDIREYRLNNFCIKILPADIKILSRWSYLYQNKRIDNIIYRMAWEGLFPYNYIDYDFPESINGECFSTYHKGYFFDLKNYENMRDDLRKEIRLKDKIHVSRELMNILQNYRTVSVHIRRGDFLKLDRDLSNKMYYPRAFEYMSECVKTPYYLIFSDDIEWVKNNMNIQGKKYYVSGNGYRDYEELMLIRSCKNHIIANSTFSYWGAYLGESDNSVVICPAFWKKKIIPDGWICI